MKRNTLILKLTNMVLATSNNHTAEITATISDDFKWQSFLHE